jgi:hypothetical protein
MKVNRHLPPAAARRALALHQFVRVSPTFVGETNNMAPIVSPLSHEVRGRLEHRSKAGAERRGLWEAGW